MELDTAAEAEVRGRHLHALSLGRITPTDEVDLKPRSVHIASLYERLQRFQDWLRVPVLVVKGPRVYHDELRVSGRYAWEDVAGHIEPFALVVTVWNHDKLVRRDVGMRAPKELGVSLGDT